MEEILSQAFSTGDIKIVIVAVILYFVIAIQRGNTKRIEIQLLLSMVVMQSMLLLVQQVLVLQQVMLHKNWFTSQISNNLKEVNL